MKLSKFFLVGIFGSLLFNPSLKAGFDSWGYVDDHTDSGIKFYKVNSLTGANELVSEECDFKSEYGYCYPLADIQFNEGTNKIEYKHYINRSGQKEWQRGEQNDTVSQWFSYDINTGTKTKISSPWKDGYTGSGSLSKIFQSSDGTIMVQVGEDKLVTKKANGELHLGENSLVTKEENGMQNLWGQDSSGNKIPVNIKGSKLLIDGRDVEQSINNVGALSAALTGLPTVPSNTTLACGLGTGTHGGDIAFSGGCASKLNEKLSINYAASITMPGQTYAGDFEDSFSARAGFVWKLGKSLKPTQIGLKDKKIINEKISTLEKSNEILKAKNDEIITQNQKLLARLEKLENIALKFQSSSDMISVATKD